MELIWFQLYFFAVMPTVAILNFLFNIIFTLIKENKQK